MRLSNENKITLHLIRHGKTVANEKRLYCGFSDLPLSQGGIAALKAQPKPAITADRYWHTSLRRTQETLNILFDSPPSGAIPNLREINLGAFELFSYEDLKTNPAYLAWIEAIDISRPPQGETKSEFAQRIQAGLQEAALDLNPGQSAVVVTHGGVIATLMELLLPGEKNYYEWQPACGQGYSLQFERGALVGYSKL